MMKQISDTSRDVEFVRLKVNARGLAALDGLRERVRGRDVVLLDYPVYYNVGDLLIFLGLQQMFRDEGVRLRLAQTHHSHSVAKIRTALAPETLILFHGGGNFGDLYPKLHGDRLDVLAALPEREMIVLPQTIHFRSQEALEKTRRIAKTCRDLTIYVRDEESGLVAETFGAKVIGCPDTAHYLKPAVNTSRNGETFLFRRRDFETEVDEQGFDWSEMITGFDKFVMNLSKGLAKVASVSPGSALDRALLRIWTRQCEILLNRACVKFGQYEFLDADRLHAVILASLMHMPMIYGDTRFGKISRYREAWLDTE